jgi:hypothetical protein
MRTRLAVLLLTMTLAAFLTGVFGTPMSPRAVAAKGSGGSGPKGSRIPGLPTGEFSVTVQGSLAACLDPTTFAQEACSTSGALIYPLTVLETGSTALDSSGASCVTTTEVDSSSPPNASSPIITTDEHIVSTVTGYDSATGIGDAAFTSYTGGTCNGVNFDDTGATETSSGTLHFAVSQGGSRVDAIISQLTVVPADSVGTWSYQVTYLKQK